MLKITPSYTSFGKRREAWWTLSQATRKKFGDWDLRVQSLLDPAEREFYLSPYDGLDIRYLDYRSVSRMNHLTKILLNRQGINAHGSGQPRWYALVPSPSVPSAADFRSERKHSEERHRSDDQRDVIRNHGCTFGYLGAPTVGSLN